MIPILYEANETTFTSNGIGRLSDATSCIVPEERNGKYELTITYPVTGKWYSELTEGRIIVATHDDNGDLQPFVIYRKSAPMNGLVTFNAHHVSYLLNNIICAPFPGPSQSVSSMGAAFDLFNAAGTTLNTNPFTFWTDNTTAGTCKSILPASIRSLLGGVQGSLLDVFGGEYEWDKFTVKNHAQRGSNTGITIRYGKNLTDIQQTIDHLGTYNGIVGYWYKDEDGVETVVSSGIVAQQGATVVTPIVMDFTGEFDTEPSVAQLEAKAASYLANNTPWVPNENIKISFVQLWQTEEFKDVANLQRVRLCDRVNVYYPQLGVTVSNVEVIKVTYNVLLDRYDSMELGQPQSTLSQTLTKTYTAELKKATENMVTTSAMQAAINHATELITGGLGGVIKFKYNANGEPIAMLVLDSNSESTAINIWQWNIGGFGHSGDGGQNYDVAITQDGQINANFITTGYLNAAMIHGGTLSLGGANNGNGVLHVYDANGNLIGSWDNTGAYITGLLTMEGDKILATVGEKRQVVYRPWRVEGYYAVGDYETFRFDCYETVSGVEKLMAARNWYYEPVTVYGYRSLSDMTLFPYNDKTRMDRVVGFVKNVSDLDSISGTTIDSNVKAFHEEISLDGTNDVVRYYFAAPGSGTFTFSPSQITFAGNDKHIEVNDAASIRTSGGYSPQTPPLISIKGSNGQEIRLVGDNGIFLGRYDGYYNQSGYIPTASLDDTKEWFSLHGNRIIANAYANSGEYAKLRLDQGAILLEAKYPEMSYYDEYAKFSISNGNFAIEYGYSYGSHKLSCTGNSTALYWDSKAIQVQSSSSIRYKNSIEQLTDEELDPHRLYNLEVKQFRYNTDVPLQYPDMYGKTIPGLIAEEVAEVYPAAVIHHPDHPDDIESWDERRLIPPMLKLIQEQHEKIEELEARIERLEALIGGTA